MWVEVDGVRKKVACGPCIRGHRSSKCDHKDRVLQEVRKPGRPLSSCPHPVGSCNCGPISISYTIPKTSSCLCPSDNPATATPTPSVISTGNGNRVQKARSRKSTSTISSTTLEKALNASGQGDVTASPQAIEPPANAAFLDSEPTSSTGGSPASSNSSTPRISPALPRRQSQSDTKRLPNEFATVVAKPANVSSCCQPKAAIKEAESPVEPQRGSCCSSKPVELKKETVVEKSCCSGPKSGAHRQPPPQLETHSDSHPNTLFFQQSPIHGQFPSGVPMQVPGYGSVPQGALPHMVMPTQHGNIPGSFTMAPAYGYIAPMYGSSVVYPPSTQMAMQNGHQSTDSSSQTNVEHNCHCGDSCDCFGCAAHPQNSTTTAYLLDMDNFMRNGGSGPSYILPAYPHQTAPMPQHQYGFAYYPSAQGINLPRIPQTMPFQFNATTIYSPDTSPDWPQGGLHMPIQATPTSELEHFDINGQHEDHSQTSRPGTANQEESSDSPGDQDNEPTLSPSSFFLQTLVLPGCNDVTGTCQCGDGCDCVGCLTHGGHDGVLLETSTDLQPPDFDFMASGNGISDQHSQEPFFTPPYTETPT